MIRICYYKGCGVVYGEKEPLSDKSITHGLCPKHHEISLKELKAEIERLRDKAGGFKVLIVEDSTLFRQLLKETLHGRFPSIGFIKQGMEKRHYKRWRLSFPISSLWISDSQVKMVLT